MKITISRDQLKEKLSMLQGVTGKATTMPILSHCLMAATKEGITLTATDLTISLKEQLTAKVEREGAACIPARKFYEIISESDSDIVLETTKEGTSLEIRSGKSRFRVSCLPANEFPNWPEAGRGGTITLTAADLADMIDKTIYAAGETDTRYTLNGLLFHLQPSGNKITMVGTDGHRLALINKEIDLAGWDETRAIVPKKALSELNKLMDGKQDVACSISKNHILFEVPGASVLATLIEGTYPNYETIIPHNDTHAIHINKAMLIKAIKKVSIMAREGTKGISVEVADQKMTLTSSNPELGEATDEIPAEHIGPEPIKIGFNAKYLLDAASAFTEESMTIALESALSPALLTHNGNRNYLNIVMPMRI